MGAAMRATRGWDPALHNPSRAKGAPVGEKGPGGQGDACELGAVAGGGLQAVCAPEVAQYVAQPSVTSRTARRRKEGVQGSRFPHTPEVTHQPCRPPPRHKLLTSPSRRREPLRRRRRLRNLCDPRRGQGPGGRGGQTPAVCGLETRLAPRSAQARRISVPGSFTAVARYPTAGSVTVKQPGRFCAGWSWSTRSITDCFACPPLLETCCTTEKEPGGRAERRRVMRWSQEPSSCSTGTVYPTGSAHHLESSATRRAWSQRRWSVGRGGGAAQG